MVMKKQWKETDYGKKLRDPRWQKRRLEIMERDEFRCQHCMDSEETLNVHHCYYSKGNDPWDYPNTSLVTLCETCHEEETASNKIDKLAFIEIFCRLGFLSRHFNDISSTMYEEISRGNLAFSNGVHRDLFASVLGWAIGNSNMRYLMQEKYFEFLKEKREKADEREKNG